MKNKRYIVEDGITFAGFDETIDNLRQYLYDDPYPQYRLVSCEKTDTGAYCLVWELKD